MRAGFQITQVAVPGYDTTDWHWLNVMNSVVDNNLHQKGNTVTYISISQYFFKLESKVFIDLV